jgi:hypothetical protein
MRLNEVTTRARSFSPSTRAARDARFHERRGRSRPQRRPSTRADAVPDVALAAVSRSNSTSSSTQSSHAFVPHDFLDDRNFESYYASVFQVNGWRTNSNEGATHFVRRQRTPRSSAPPIRRTHPRHAPHPSSALALNARRRWASPSSPSPPSSVAPALRLTREPSPRAPRGQGSTYRILQRQATILLCAD